MRGDGKRESWLLIKEKDKEASRNEANADFLEELSSSVKSGRSMEEIAGGEAPAQKKKPAAKAADELKSLVERYPEVQLATLVDKPPEGAQWVHELKFDGYRLLGFVSGGTSPCTRNGKDWTESFHLSRVARKTEGRRCRVDMEAVILDAEGRAVFKPCRPRSAAKESRKDGPVFDLLHLDGRI
jgi:bifunctional non-homologous end joining protein LigD